MKKLIFTLNVSSKIALSLSLFFTIFACTKEIKENSEKITRVEEFKKGLQKGYQNWSEALNETSMDYFGKPHDGKVDLTSFENDVNKKLSRKYPNSTPPSQAIVDKFKSLKPWNPQNESLDSYLKKNGNSKVVREYIVELKGQLESVIVQNNELIDGDLTKSINKFIGELKDGAQKVEKRAESDSRLSEQELFSILASTGAVLGIADASLNMAQLFIKNLSVNLQQGLQTRCWICADFNTLVNIVGTIIVSTVTFVVNTIVFVYNVGAFILGESSWQQLGQDALNWVSQFGTFTRGTLGAIGGDYTCFIRRDLWNCP
jgi:ribosome-associated translation inhibitor RaiA